MPAELSDLRTSSQYRYRASAAERRQHGGNTITCFFVWEKQYENDSLKWAKIIGYGKTPTDRAMDAKFRYLGGERNKW